MKEQSIGGYLGLEIRHFPILPQREGVLLNSGRSALQYLLGASWREGAPAGHGGRVWLPDYYCPEVEEHLRRIGYRIEHYPVGNTLEIESLPALEDGDRIVIVNYFGIKDSYVAEMARRLGRAAIIDNCQGWYANVPAGVDAFFSAAKFFGVADGGLAVGPGADAERAANYPRSESYERALYLLKRVDVGAEAGYADFLKSRQELAAEPMKRISHLTEGMLSNQPFAEIKKIRLKNFSTLHLHLGVHNPLSTSFSMMMECPMVYPLMIKDGAALREELIKEKIYVARYWAGSKDSQSCHPLADMILPLPIDQRYDTNDMNRIYEIILSHTPSLR